jgi:hypothetical protein
MEQQSRRNLSKTEKIKRLVDAGRYEFSVHAERELRTDRIMVAALERALKDCEIIEDYPDDQRGASFLILGFAGQRPIHAVCAIRQNPEELLLITVYDPSRRSQRWEDDYRRRRS